MVVRILRLIILFLSLIFFPHPVMAREQEIVRLEGALTPGQKLTQQFLVDTASQLRIRGNGIGLASESAKRAKIKMIFLDPAGRRIDPTALAGDKSVKLKKNYIKKSPSAKGVISYILFINNPSAGRWSVELSLSAEENNPALYWIMIDTEDAEFIFYPLKGYQSVKPAQLVYIEAKLEKKGKPVSQAQVVARVKGSSMLTRATVEQILIMRDDGTEGDKITGDGIYTATFRPEKIGDYHIKLTATDNKNFSRLAWSGFAAATKGARLKDNIKEIAVDTDKNGKYESLNLFVEVEVLDTLGNYYLQGRLYTQKGSIGEEPRVRPLDYFVQIAEPPGAFVKVPDRIGTHQISLLFPGEWFLKSKLDGPYFFSLELEDANLIGSPFFIKNKAFQTKPYRWSDFEAKNLPE